MASMALSFWKNSSSKTKRIITIAAVFLLTIAVSIGGLLTPLTPEEADSLKRDLDQTRNTLGNMSLNSQVSFIFGNNFIICLAAFVPIAGPIFEFYVLYSTGVVIAADSYGTVNPLLVFFSLFIFPFAWLEFISYSTGIAGSIWLTWRLTKHLGRKELKNTCILISICAGLLLAGAIIETALIAALPPA